MIGAPPLSPGVQGKSGPQPLVSQQEQGLTSPLLPDRARVLPGAAPWAAARDSCPLQRLSLMAPQLFFLQSGRSKMLEPLDQHPH